MFPLMPVELMEQLTDIALLFLGHHFQTIFKISTWKFNFVKKKIHVQKYRLLYAIT